MILCTVFCVVRFHKPSSHLYFLPPFCYSSSPPSFLTNPFYSLLCSLSVVLSGEAGWATHIGQLHLENLQEEKGCEKKITNERIKKRQDTKKKKAPAEDKQVKRFEMTIWAKYKSGICISVPLLSTHRSY